MILTTVKQRASYTSTNTQKHIIDLTDCVADTTSNIFENVVFEALNDLIDDFAINPDKYLKPKHKQQIDAIASQYLQDESN